MRLIKLASLVAVVAMAAMTFVGVSSAMGSNTQLCKVDLYNRACPPGLAVTHAHEVTLGGKEAILLISPISIECDVLFLSTIGGVLALGAPQQIHGKFTYFNCNGGCLVTEESPSALTTVLRTAHELAITTYQYKLYIDCGFLLTCGYSGEGLQGHALGPLLAAHLNGELRLEEQTLKIYLNHGLCWDPMKLDLLTIPLTKTFIET